VHPTRRQEGLIVVALDDELLVYDLERHRAHCLNRAAALVWRHCDGETGVAELGHVLRREMNADLGDEYVWYALRRFSNSRLLASSPEAPPQAARWTRRELLRRLAAAGVAAVALPTVMSVIAPATLQAQASCLPAGSACNPPDIPCCAGLRCRGLPPGSPSMCR
jgi:hypothetical protein